jgi:hypothetical protein
MRAADLQRSHREGDEHGRHLIWEEGMEMNPPAPRCTINHIVCRAEQAKGRGGAVAGPRGNSRWSTVASADGQNGRAPCMAPARQEAAEEIPRASLAV